MKKLATLLLTTALVGGLTLTSFASTASAADSYRGNNRGNFATQQQYGGQNMQGPGQNMRGPGMQNDTMRGPGGLGVRGPNGLAQGGLVHFVCSDNGAPRVEIALNNLSDRLTLDADQTSLFEAFKTSALTAQTAYADSCETPVATAGTLDPVELMQLHAANDTANVAAIESVLPSLEAFYNSLSDEQKANFTLQRNADMRVGQGWFTPGQNQQGQQGNFGPRGTAPGQNNFGPNQGPRGQGNFGPGQIQQGQGFGPRANS